MAWDPCGSAVHWSLVAAAPTLSTLAGVLAGFLVVATAAIFATFYRTNSNTIALFAVGVPALTTSSFLFGFISGILPIDQKSASKIILVNSVLQDTRCFQLWSQWLFAMSLLAIGGAVLTCGFAWALIAYTEEVSQKRIALIGRAGLGTLRNRRNFVLKVAGGMSTAGLVTATIILVNAMLVYVKAVNASTWHLCGLYLVFQIWGAGLYAICRVVRLAWVRTRDAMRENKSAYTRAFKAFNVREDSDLTYEPDGDKDTCRSIPWWLCAIAWLIPGTALSLWITIPTVNTDQPGRVHVGVWWIESIGEVAVLYLIILAFYCFIQHKWPPDDDKDAVKSYNDKNPATAPAEAIKVRYDYGQVFSTTLHVVWLALASIALAAVFYQGDLWHDKCPWLTTLTVLVVGGLYPLLIILGLAYSLASGQDKMVPHWKTLEWFKILVP
jgi:hypothetical protein